MTPQHVEAWEWHWTPVLKFFGVGFNPVEMTTTRLAAFRDARRATVKDTTIRRELRALRHGLEVARGREWPVTIPERWPDLRESEDDIDEARSSKPPPIEVLLAVRGKCDEELRDRLDLDAMSLLRAHELMRLRADWIFRAPPELAAIGCPAVIAAPRRGTKTRRPRLIPISKEAYDIIARRIEANAVRAAKVLERELRTGHKRKRQIDFGLVFPSNRKKALYKAIDAARVEAVENYGKPEAERRGFFTNVTLRKLRGLSSTHAERETGDKKAVADILGHASLDTTEHYLHSDMGRLFAAGAAVSKSYADIIAGGGAKGAEQDYGLVIGGSRFQPAFTGKNLVGAAGFELAAPSSQSKVGGPKYASSRDPESTERDLESRVCARGAEQGGGAKVIELTPAVRRRKVGT